MAELVHCDWEACPATAPMGILDVPKGWVGVEMRHPRADFGHDTERVFCTREHAIAWLAESASAHKLDVARVVHEGWRALGRRLFALGALAFALGAGVAVLVIYLFR